MARSDLILPTTGYDSIEALRFAIEHIEAGEDERLQDYEKAEISKLVYKTNKWGGSTVSVYLNDE